MKILRFGLVCLIAAVTTAALRAQTVQFLILQWSKAEVQNSASNVDDASATPYAFRTSIQGTEGDPLTASTFSPSPILGLTDGSVGPSLSFKSQDSEWAYNSTPYADVGALTTAYPTSGANAYKLNLDNTGHTSINGVSLPTTVTFPTVPNLSTNNLNTPLVTLTGGTWQSNGHFLVNSVSSAVTLSFNNIYNTAPSAESYHYDIEMNGPAPASLSGGDTEGFINMDPTGGSPLSAVPDLTIAAGQLIDGNTYTLKVNYQQILAYDDAALSNSAFAAALLENSSQITIDTPLSAVPEPAAYTLLGGLVALAGVLRQRRKKRTV